MLIDANILLYAVIVDYPQHKAAKEWLESQFNGPKRVGLPWPTLLAFLRISTHPRIFSNPLAISEAWELVTQWLGLSNVWIPHPLDRHSEILGELLVLSDSPANLVQDAHLAALAVEHGLTVYSCDSDFARFRKVTWINPIEENSSGA